MLNNMGVQYYSTLFSYKACRLVVHAIINMSTCVIPQNMCLGFAWTTTCKALYYLKNTECLCCGNRLFIVLCLQFNQIVNWNCNGWFTQTISHSSEVWYNKIGFLYYFLFEVGLSAMYFSYPKSVTKHKFYHSIVHWIWHLPLPLLLAPLLLHVWQARSMGGSNKIKVSMLLYNTSRMIHHRGVSLSKQQNYWFNNLSWHTAGFVTIYCHESNKPNLMMHKEVSPHQR